MLENILLLVTLGASILLLFVVGQESRDPYFKKTFFGYIITSSLWSLLLSIILIFPEQATLLGKLRMTFICWTPYFLILSIQKLFNKPLNKQKAQWLALGPLLLSGLILLTPIIVKSYIVDQYTLIVNKGPLAYLFFIYHLAAILYQLYLVNTERVLSNQTRRQVLVGVIFYSVVLSYCLGVLLAIVLPLFFKLDIFIGLSPLASVIMGLGISYSVWRYQIFKIRLVLRESLISTTSLVFFSLGIAGFLYIFGINTFHNLALVPWTMLVAVFLSQLFNNQIKAVLYHSFYRDKLLFEDALRYIYRSFGNVLELPVFRKKVSALIDKIFKPIQQELVVFAEPRTDTRYNNPEVYFEDHNNYPAQETAIEHDLAISLVFNQKLLGFIFLTLNTQYLNYTQENIQLLIIFARQVSIALANTLSYEELQQKQQRMFQTEKIALLGQLTAGIVHELRNPLTALTMTVSNMKQCLVEANYDQKNIERLWTAGQNSIQEMKQFMDNMLTFSRDDHCEMQAVPLKTIIDEILPLIRKKASEHSVELQLVVDAKLKLTCNTQRLKQVFLNLLLNGLDAMPQGGTLVLSATRKGKQVIITISDTGSGIPTDILAKIFTPFYTTKKEGTGLGLAIVKEIIEAHRGSVSVSSSLGQGTQFTITLPQE